MYTRWADAAYQKIDIMLTLPLDVTRSVFFFLDLLKVSFYFLQDPNRFYESPTRYKVDSALLLTFSCSSISFSESSLLQKMKKKHIQSTTSIFSWGIFFVNGFEALSLKPKSKDFQTYFGNTYFMSTPHCSKSLFLVQKFR